MSWQEKPFFEKEKSTDVTSEMVRQIKDQEQKDEIERKEAARRRENFERRKVSKEKGTTFVSIEQEEYLKEEQQKAQLEKREEVIVPQLWKSLAEYRVSIIGKIDLEDIEKKTSDPDRKESIFMSESIDELHEKAQHILGNEEIDQEYIQHFIKDFITLYDIDEIENDIKAVIEKEERIKRSDSPERARLKKLATILEAILVEGIAKYEWLGRKIKILAPSKFDELCHGVDAVIELGRDEQANEFLALGIDVSYRSVDGDLFVEKIQKLLGDIDHNHLTQIKYFKDNKGNALQNLYVPKIVVSVDGKTTENLVRIWAKKDEPTNTQAFEKHSIAADIVGQIAEQCKLFSQYARTKGAYEIADAYDEVFDLLLKISEEVPEAKQAITAFEQSKFVNKIEQIIGKRVSKIAA